MSAIFLSMWGAMLVHSDQHYLTIEAKDWIEFHQWQKQQVEEPEVPPFKPSPLQVTGIGKVKALPDIAVVTGQIQTKATQDHLVYDEAAKIINQVQASIGEADVELSFTELSTTEMRDPKCLDHNKEAGIRHTEIISDKHHNDRIRRYDHDHDNLRPVRARMFEKVCPVTHIEGRVDFTAWIKPADMAGEFLNRFTVAGVHKVNLFGYDFSDYDALYKEAGEKAVINAKTKAEIVARGSGSNITELVDFSISAPQQVARFGPQATVISPHANGPVRFKTVTQTVVVQEASTELVTIPPTYETVRETVVVQPQYVGSNGRVVPAVTKQVNRRVIKTPASTQERVVPAVTKTMTQRVPVSSPQKAAEISHGGAASFTASPTSGASQTNDLKMSLLSGPQTVTVTARMDFLYDTPINGEVFETD